ncbi:MAG: peptidase T [Pirellulales bacterium]|nr:peptidase T [Pirellulales bacterium]
MMDSERLLERFLRYVQIDTTAREQTTEYPSSSGQLQLGRMLVEELHALGVDSAEQDENGIVLATLPATTDRVVPTIAYCAHLDTSPETPGKDVKPQVIHDYPGGDIALPGAPNQVIRVVDNPELDQLVGRTLITTDGTTLLGADDKAGVAIIVEAVAWLTAHPEIEHGPIRICFTCDEEVGRGVSRLDLKKLDAATCYTLDGQGADTIDTETFSADLAVVTIRGVNIHPSIAKGRMTNAVRVAADFVERLPRQTQSPETTEGREGFLHPYEISGGVGEAKIRILLREFDSALLEGQAKLLAKIAAASMAEFPSANIDVKITPQYRNLGEGLAREPRAVGCARRALERLGRKARATIIRGGTDGSRLTEMGLPTPNLSSGQHTPHSRLEWACLDEMILSVEWLVAIAEAWAESGHDA